MLGPRHLAIEIRANTSARLTEPHAGRVYVMAAALTGQIEQGSLCVEFFSEPPEDPLSTVAGRSARRTLATFQVGGRSPLLLQPLEWGWFCTRPGHRLVCSVKGPTSTALVGMLVALVRGLRGGAGPRN